MSSRLFIGGISYDTTKHDLQEYFSRFGYITDCSIIYNKSTGISKGYGFIKIKDRPVANTILEHGKHYIRGRLVDVDEALDGEAAAPNHLITKGLRRLFVGGLNSQITVRHLLEYFSTFGKVLNIFKIADPISKVERNFGYVEFEKVEDAQVALNFKPHVVKGHKLNLQNHKSGLKNSIVLIKKNRHQQMYGVESQSTSVQAFASEKPSKQNATLSHLEPEKSIRLKHSATTQTDTSAQSLHLDYPRTTGSSHKRHPVPEAADKPADSGNKQTTPLGSQSSKKIISQRFKIFYRHLRRLASLTNSMPHAADNNSYHFNRESTLSFMKRTKNPY